MGSIDLTVAPTASDHLTAPPLNVAVIGAGLAGLVAARALKTEGHRVVVYEKSERLGGTWAYDPRVESDPLSLDPDREIVHSSLYQSLRTNLPRQLMGFSDYPFSTYGDPRTFPGHPEVLRFINEFAAEFRLAELIRFETEVVRVERVDSRNDEWIVESRTREMSSNELFDAVVVCSGHHTIPKLADFPGREKWAGQQIHSHNYRVPDPFQNQVVVVIGDGPSAWDISLEIADVAKQVYLSSRSPKVKVAKLDCGDNIWQHSKIDHANENGEVVFEDGAVVHADIILHCTGFMYSFPFLKTEGIVIVEEGRVGPLYKHIFPPKLGPNLSFLGIPCMTVATQTIYFQAKWVARILSGKVWLPSEEEMETEVRQHYQLMEEKGIPKHYTHALQFELDYLDWLANQVGEIVHETTHLYVKSYVKFVFEGNKQRLREWEPNLM
ncbi:flavin-containing monooxygenase FMO GS-OX-like 7 isoform X1 [Salvia hispanica]|uniref:flavin-containing monooxygenase FMO GS-OX-like 7 isoform X1 n=1 Tax=Salvia hispanica TaxID=49212 RepID=UPI0020099219|nr:flavin-containing monooxygenase FMO GS-OX-like 7 isoform X1 [Salvia hispanica]